MAFRKKVSILGVVVGSVFDIVASNIWGMFAMFYVMFKYDLLEMALISPTELTEQILYIFRTDVLVMAANFVVGAFFSILGGYISAYIAKHNELLNGALASFLCVGSGLYALFTGNYSVSLFLAISSLFLSPLLAMFGGYLRLKQKLKKEAKIIASEESEL